MAELTTSAKSKSIEFLRLAARFAKPDELARILEINNMLRRARRTSGDGSELGGTALTALRLCQSPIGLLIDSGNIGSEEVQAADQIWMAYRALSAQLWIKSGALERIDGSRRDQGPWPGHIAAAVHNYQSWADRWSRRAKRGDRTLQIVIATVIDERSFRSLDFDLGLRRGKSKLATIRGLRDHAARFQKLDRLTKALWLAEEIGPVCFKA